MPDRTIDSIYDVTEADVDALYRSLELTRALEAYARDLPEHEQTLDPETLAEAETRLDLLWQTMAVVVAHKQDSELSVEDISGDGP